MRHFISVLFFDSFIQQILDCLPRGSRWGDSSELNQVPAVLEFTFLLNKVIIKYVNLNISGIVRTIKKRSRGQKERQGVVSLGRLGILALRGNHGDRGAEAQRTEPLQQQPN